MPFPHWAPGQLVEPGLQLSERQKGGYRSHLQEHDVPEGTAEKGLLLDQGKSGPGEEPFLLCPRLPAEIL